MCVREGTGTTNITSTILNIVEVFPTIFKMVDVMFVVPVQTAAVERGFSMHRIVKNRLTNRLKITTLNSLLRIKLLT